ncbi:polyribonucleotide 5'-hydroxyl-kinase clp1 [Anaeramoeba flamelloides]|uniref:Polyribonucleotide 5'-hydroxyl-kinase clp1 n=1 Tax=Anaeramoeba flamelloides TaxID=1746091 RepID=A0AAV7ZI53_9EUKA|nr:polyribonucleotide 5'-hydroxyl-kinase clp1 [Anaeramoeba flamelloides]
MEQKYTLKKRKQIIVKVHFTQNCSIKLLSGDAKIFGYSLETNKPYSFTGASFPIHTQNGCEILLTGEFYSYINTDRVIQRYDSFCQSITEKRLNQNKKEPLRILICGPTDTGKSSLSKIIVNLSVQSGYRPLFVDLDLGQSDLSIPGTLNSIIVDQPILTKIPFGSNNINTLYYGNFSVLEGLPHYLMLCKTLSESVEKQFQKDEIYYNSGCVINTMGWVTGKGYSLILDLINIFKVNIVISTGDYGLFRNLDRDLKKNINLHYIPKPFGLRIRSRNDRIIIRSDKYKKYFLYSKQINQNPFEITLNIKDLELYKISYLTYNELLSRRSQKNEILNENLFCDFKIQNNMLDGSNNNRKRKYTTTGINHSIPLQKNLKTLLHPVPYSRQQNVNEINNRQMNGVIHNHELIVIQRMGIDDLIDSWIGGISSSKTNQKMAVLNSNVLGFVKM